MTSRQFYIMLSLFVIMTKMQRLSSLLFDSYGKDGYLVIIIYGLINFFAVFVAYFVYKFLDREKFKAKSKFVWATLIKKLTMFATSVYFVTQALVLFEHVQNIFADTLFDKFAWSIFSLLFLFAVFYLARTGIKNIALNFELFALIIFGSLALIAILGASHSDYSVVLPLQTIDFKNIFSSILKFNVWFGDFFVIFYMLVHTKKPKLSKTALTYGLSIIFVTFLTITFYGVFGTYSSLQPGMISTITEQSMLGVNIGRVDWFLILFAEIGTILSCAVCLYFANKSLCAVFTKVKPLWLLIIIGVAFYVMNVFVLVDKFVVREFFFGIGSTLSIILKLFTIIMLFILSLKNYFKIRKQKKEARSGKIA